MPSDVAAALAQDSAATAFFDQLAYSHQKEWVRWVQDAKQTQIRSAPGHPRMGLVAQPRTPARLSRRRPTRRV